MYTDAKVLLRKHSPELAQYIKLESLLPYLNKYSLLTDSEYDELLNVVINERTRVLKLIRFIEGKGPEGFQRFLRALDEEPEHLGHKELTQIFSSYRKLFFKHTVQRETLARLPYLSIWRYCGNRQIYNLHIF